MCLEYICFHLCRVGFLTVTVRFNKYRRVVFELESIGFCFLLLKICVIEKALELKREIEWKEERKECKKRLKARFFFSVHVKKSLGKYFGHSLSLSDFSVSGVV